MNRLPMIEFDCPACREELEVPRRAAGKEKLCPACNAPVQVPEVRKENQTTPDKKLPMRIRIGRFFGIEGRVSKKDAGRILLTVAGGAIALGGVIVAAKLGVKLPDKK